MKSYKGESAETSRSRSAEIARMRNELVPMFARRFKAPAGFIEEFAAGMDETDWTAMRGAHVFAVTPTNLAHIMRGWIKQFNESTDGFEKKNSGARAEHREPSLEDYPILKW